jgi:hypothetical protein
MKQFIAYIVVALLLTACTENQKVKTFGGTGHLNLPAGQKLVTVTWKETNLWYLTRPMTVTDSVETYEFVEESNFGMVEGKYIIKESR